MNDIILYETFARLKKYAPSDNKQLRLMMFGLLYLLDGCMQKSGIKKELDIIDYLHSKKESLVPFCGEENAEKLALGNSSDMPFVSDSVSVVGFDEEDMRNFKPHLEFIFKNPKLYFGLVESYLKLNEAINLMESKDVDDNIYRVLFEASSGLNRHNNFKNGWISLDRKKAVNKRWKSKDKVKEYANKLYLSGNWPSPKQASKLLADKVIEYSEKETDFRFSPDAHQTAETIYKWFLAEDKNKDKEK